MTPSISRSLGGRLGAAAACAALLVTATACTGSGGSASGHSATTSAATPAGPQVDDRADGVRFTLPQGWHEIPLGAKVDTALARFVHDRTVVSQIEQQVQVGQFRGMRVFALKPHAHGKPETLTLAVSRSTSSTLANLRSAIAVTAQQYASDTPAFAELPLPAGRALRVHYRLNDGDATTQYYLLAGPRAFVLTLTRPGGVSDLATDDGVAKSLRLTSGA